MRQQQLSIALTVTEHWVPRVITPLPAFVGICFVIIREWPPMSHCGFGEKRVK